MTSLVTGGAGFIGSHIVDALIDRGHQVIVLDDLSGGYVDNINPKARFIQGSVVDSIMVDSLFAKYKFEYVYHLAAYAAEGLSHFIRRFNYTNNIIGSINLINASLNYPIKCFVFTSSIAVYGSSQTPMIEDMKPEPEDPYGVAKYAVELDLAAASRMFGLKTIIFRPHNVYGIRQNTGDKYRNVIGIFMNQILQDLPCTIFGDGNQIRAFTDITDVAPVIADSAENPQAYGHIFNIGSGQFNSVIELAQMVQKVMGRNTGIKHLEDRKEVVAAFSDHTKACNILNYHPQVSLEDGLRKMAQWVKKVGPRQTQKFACIEVKRNLPSVWRD